MPGRARKKLATVQGMRERQERIWLDLLEAAPAWVFSEHGPKYPNGQVWIQAANALHEATEGLKKLEREYLHKVNENVESLTGTGTTQET